MTSKFTASELIAIVMLAVVVLVVTLMLFGPMVGQIFIPGR